MRYSKIRNVKSPSIANRDDAGIDFFIPEDLGWESKLISPSGSIVLPSGIKMGIPPGTVLLCLEKSSVAQAGLIVGAKVIDSGYQGEIHIHLINPTTNSVMIKAGQKIAQFILIPLAIAQRGYLNEVPINELYWTKSQRGSGAFGSSGKF